MAQDINVPVVTPNPIQFQPPTDLVNSYLNRQQQGQQYAINQVGNLADTLYQQKQQRIQNQLSALQAYSQIAGTSGITAANQIAPNIPGMANTRDLPQDPFNTSYASPSGGVGGGSSNAGSQGANPQWTVQTNPGQTMPSASSQGSPQTLGNNQPQGQPSQAIMLSHNAGLVTPTSQSLMDQMASNSAQIQRSAGVGGSFAQDRARKYTEANSALSTQLAAQKSANDIAMQPAQDAKLQNDVNMLPTANAKAEQDLANSQQQIPLERGGKTAEIQKTYGAQDMKTQQGIKALQDLQDAWDKVPENLKGPRTGTLTSRAGSLFSGQSAEVTTYNKILKNTATTLATALLPENVRANPLMVEELRATLPTLQSSPKEMSNLMDNFHSQLQNNAKLNYETSQKMAQSFGGNLSKTQIPELQTAKASIQAPIHLNGKNYVKVNGQWYQQ